MDKLKDRLRKCIKNIEGFFYVCCIVTINTFRSIFYLYLNNCAESPGFVPPDKREEIETEEFKAHYDPGLVAAEASYKSIPKFYNKLPKVDDTLAKKLREEARALFLQTKSGELLSGTELKHLWTLLDKGDLSTNGDAKFLNYFEFQKVGEKAGPEYK